jgi:hypothetical protein
VFELPANVLTFAQKQGRIIETWEGFRWN